MLAIDRSSWDDEVDMLLYYVFISSSTNGIYEPLAIV